MLTEAVDRRRATRRAPEPGEPLSRVRLRAGRELLVVDVSPIGACVQGDTRLLPGTHVEVHITGAQGRTLVRARVVRCVVWHLTADEIQYRGALAFGVLLDLTQAPHSAPAAA